MDYEALKKIKNELKQVIKRQDEVLNEFREKLPISDKGMFDRMVNDVEKLRASGKISDAGEREKLFKQWETKIKDSNLGI